MDSGFKRFMQSWLTNTLAVLVAVEMLPGLHFRGNDLWAPFVTSLVLGILNALIRPILMLLALPLLIFTLGLFTFVINALMLYAVGLLPFFKVDSFGWAFLGALIISLVSMVLNFLTGARTSRFTFRHHRRPPGSEGGNGPVIDV